MKNIIKTTTYSAVALSSIAFNQLETFAVPDYGATDVETRYGGNGSGDIKGTFENILDYILTFLAIIAVAFAIYGGFQILTAGGDDEKVKKGKTTLINALIGVFIVMISWTLVSWIFTSAGTAATGGA